VFQSGVGQFGKRERRKKRRREKGEEKRERYLLK
jgi:hypothetical protein